MRAVRLALVIFILPALFISVCAEGPYCSQNGLGPKDMMMTNGDMNPKYMWEKQGGSVQIPVVLDHAYSHKEREVIFGGLAEMASKTCIKFFVYPTPDEVHGGDSVYITKSKSKGCWSYVGKQGGHQDLSLPVGCINHRTVMHEVMHALGFSHEHVRADRDKYVQILWENIVRGRERNFEKKRDSKSDAFGPYDYSSIMHYDNRAFSSNGHDTIQPTKRFAQIGRGKRMSHWDAYKINRAYKCHHTGKGGSYGHSLPGFELGHAPENTPILNFTPEFSFRSPHPFFSGPNNNHPSQNEIDQSEIQGVDYSPFGPTSSFFDDDDNDDYYH